ncbi:hypothetical protein [Caudoviricetes sp.]|nr:hypothetical protein [Caudoviricetes sp.]
MTREESARIANVIDSMMRDVVIPAVLAEVKKELENICEQHIIYHVAKLHRSSDRDVDIVRRH